MKKAEKNEKGEKQKHHVPWEISRDANGGMNQ
jgi:hypothetical protein